MADNFNLRQFLTENKLTKNAQLLAEGVENEIVQAFSKAGVNLNGTTTLEIDAGRGQEEKDFKTGQEALNYVQEIAQNSEGVDINYEYSDPGGLWTEGTVLVINFSDSMEVAIIQYPEMNEARVEGFDVNKKAFEVTFIDKYGGRDFRILNAETPEQAEEVFTNIFVNNPDMVKSIKSIEPYQVPAPKPQAQSQPGLEGVDYGSIEIDGVDSNDYPDFVDAYVAYAEFEDGTPLSEEELYQLTDELYQSGELADRAAESLYEGKKGVEEGIHDRDVLSRPLSNPAIEPLDRSPEELGKDADSRSENILRMTYRNQINDPNISDEELRYILSGKGVKGFGGTLNAINNILASRSRMEEAKSYKVSKNSKEAQHLKKGDIIGSGEEVVSVSAGAKTPKGKVEVTLKTKDGKTKTSTWGKYTKIGVKEKETETVKENKMTQRDKYLTRLVENALGLQVTEDDNVDYTMGRHDDPNQLPNPAPELNIPEGDEMVEEKPLPKYENIEKLMQEIDKSTDEEAHKFKMQEMKRVADMLEKKCTALEEGDDSDHIDQKKLKQMKKDIMALRKGIEKMEKLGEKKFTKKETKADLKEGFDLRKFLVENKLTTNSRMLNELSPELLGRAAEKATSQGRALQANKFSQAARQQIYKAQEIDRQAKLEPMKPFLNKEINLYYDVKTDKGVVQNLTIPNKVEDIRVDTDGVMQVTLSSTSNLTTNAKAFFFDPKSDHYKLSATGFTSDRFQIKGLDQAGAQLLWKLAKAYKPDTQITPNTLIDGQPTPIAGKAFKPTPAQ